MQYLVILPLAVSLNITLKLLYVQLTLQNSDEVTAVFNLYCVTVTIHVFIVVLSCICFNFCNCIINIHCVSKKVPTFKLSVTALLESV